MAGSKGKKIRESIDTWGEFISTMVEYLDNRKDNRAAFLLTES